MAKRNRGTLKTYYETGDTPTQGQFEDLIDSVPNIIEDYPTGTVTGVGNGFGSIEIQLSAGEMLVRLVAHSTTPTNDAIRLGSTFEGTEYFQENIDEANVPLIIYPDIYAITAQSVWLAIADNVTYKYYIEK